MVFFATGNTAAALACNSGAAFEVSMPSERYEVGTMIQDMRRPRRYKASIVQNVADYRSVERRFIFGFQGGNDEIFRPVGKQNVCTPVDVHCENGTPIGKFVVPFQLYDFINHPAVLQESYTRNLELEQFLV